MSTSSPALTRLLLQLHIPSEYARYDSIEDPSALAAMEKWKQQAQRVLEEIRSLVNQDDKDGITSLALEEQANIVTAVAPFSAHYNQFSQWAAPSSEEAAQDILAAFQPPALPLLTQILTYNVKPVFLAAPHPSLNPSTGRKLARPAGGPMAAQDYYEGQTWKMHLGVGAVVAWCVEHMERDAYEDTWHLVIPPVMTLLDDYEVKYKLQGVLLVSAMLKRVPSHVLKRTGVDALIRTSLTACLTFLQNPETPHLLRAAISTSLALILLTTDLGSAARFDQLCTLIGEGVISGIWFYAEDKPDAIVASMDALPPVVHALGIGCARYLKALIPQIVHALLPQPLVEPRVDLQIASLLVLNMLIEQCSPRMPGWKVTILDAMGRCWVTAIDVKTPMPDADHKEAVGQLKVLLQTACLKLADACPSVLTDEYQRFLKCDRDVFGDLFTRVPVK